MKNLKSDKTIQNIILQKTDKNQISCKKALELASLLKIPANQIGNYLNSLNIKIIECQLGLFGYLNLTKQSISIDTNLKKAIHNFLDQGELSCKNAWGIASALNIDKHVVACACDILKIKIKQCQLGAF